MNNNDKRLIEVAFPLKQTSIDSVHEKNVPLPFCQFEGLVPWRTGVHIRVPKS